MASPVTSTGLTIEHYQRPEVKAAILRYCHDGDAFRAFNGGDGWYTRGATPEEVRLTSLCDYDLLIKRDRTLYATIDFLDGSVFRISKPWDLENGRPVNPIGTLADCRAFTLSVDIDSIKDKKTGDDITTSPEIKAAVEAAGQFFVNYLNAHGISKSVHCLYSGGGLYLHIHHALFRAKPEWTPMDREHAFRSLTMAYNALIADIEHKFFEGHLEHRGRVKFDKLNNQKRKFKCIFSIHKRLPVAVIPLDPAHIEIDFGKAKLPLSDEVLAEGSRWYQEYDINEKNALKTLLAPFSEQAEKELREQRKAKTGDYEIHRFRKALPFDKWAPCMKNIVQGCTLERAPHRAMAVLAAYLYQAGWPEDEALKLWSSVAEPVGVESRIFDCWYGQMCCPTCKTIQRESDGYPKVGLGGYGYCEVGCKCQPLH